MTVVLRQRPARAYGTANACYPHATLLDVQNGSQNLKLFNLTQQGSSFRNTN